MSYKGTLSATDLERIAAVRDQWMQTGLSTERCDRPAAESAVIAAYQSIGLTAPRIIWMGSPFGGMYAIGAIQLGGQLGDQGSNTHTLHGDGTWLANDRAVNPEVLVQGWLTVPDGGEAFLIHTEEHSAIGVGPGVYEVRRQREFAGEWRRVAD